MDHLRQDPNHASKHHHINHLAAEFENDLSSHAELSEEKLKKTHKKSWFRRMKQRFLELFHHGRDHLANTQTAIKNASTATVQKVVDKPLRYLIMASALGFLLSSILRRKK